MTSPGRLVRELLEEAQLLRSAGKLREAATIYKRLLAGSPDSRPVLNALAETALGLGDFQAGVDLLDRSLRLAPDQPVALMLRGLALREVMRVGEALESIDRAIALRPRYATALFHRANLLQLLNRFDDAIASLDLATEAKPDYAAAWVGRALLLADLRRFDAALASLDQALAAKPGYAEASYVKAEVLLLMGDFERGWELYESRWGTRARGTSQFAQWPLWTGQGIAGKTLLVHPEVGLGDFIMFSRFFPLVQALGANLLVLTPPALVDVIASWFPGLSVIRKADALPPVDLQCPVMSLPRALGTTPRTIPALAPNLATTPAAQARWQARLGAAAKPRVGLVWSGKANRVIDRNPLRHRSIPLAGLEAWKHLPFEFHSLQKEILPSDLGALSRFERITSHHHELKDFADTAALANEMDLVISIDTSVAHLAGALGKRLWMLLPYASDYRWPSGRADTPWYPTARLFRQTSPGDWAGVIDAVTQQLIGFQKEETGS